MDYLINIPLAVPAILFGMGIFLAYALANNKDFAPIAQLDDLVFTGWDIFGGNLYDAAKTALDELMSVEKYNVSANFKQRMQQLLAADGFYDGPIDSTFGTRTKDAIKAAFKTGA